MNHKWKYLLFAMILSQKHFAADDSKVVDSILYGIQDALKEKTAVDYRISIALENKHEGNFRAEVHTVRMNGKLLETLGSAYLYKGSKGESSRIVSIDIMVIKGDNRPTIVQVRTEVPPEHNSAKILIRIHLNYQTQKAKVLIF